MAPNDAGSCEWLLGEIVHSHLLERGELEPIVATLQHEQPAADATALAEHLVRHGLLTTFQATRLLEGQGRGLVLGPYILIETIGSGSVGTVYKSLGKADRRAYALKVLPLSGQWNVRQARKRLQSLPAEFHPAVVPILDVGTSAGLHYLVWPFAEGETLDQAVRREGLLPPARAGLIGLQIAQALQWCERNRVFHGSIKPTNVMLCLDGQTRLLDFGESALLGPGEEASLTNTLVQANAVSQMLDYAAPESLTNAAGLSVRGDQYSLGCTLYFGLTGRTPFPDGNAIEKMQAHQDREATPVAVLNPGVPPTLAGVVERLMQKAPEARYNSIDELITALMPLARLSAVYTPLTRPSSQFLAPRAPTMTPARSGPSLLSAVQPRPHSKPPSSKSLPPPVTPRPSSHPGLRPASSPNGSAVTPPPFEPPATPADASHPPIPLAAEVTRSEPALPASARPQRSLWQRLVRTLAFWQTKADPIACTLLTPSGVLPGDILTLQVVLHHADRSEQAQTLPDWRGTEPLPGLVDRGETVGVLLALEGVGVPKPTGQVVWAGLSAAAIFSARVPVDWEPGRPVQGALTLGLRQQTVARLEFALPVAAPQKAR